MTSPKVRVILLVFSALMAPVVTTGLAFIIVTLSKVVFDPSTSAMLLWSLTVISMITVTAPLLGSICYCILGVPLMLFSSLHRAPTASHLAGVAFVANLASPIVLYVQFWIFGDLQNTRFVAVLGWGFGTFFALIWGWLTGKIYNAMNRVFPLPSK